MKKLLAISLLFAASTTFAKTVNPVDYISYGDTSEEPQYKVALFIEKENKKRVGFWVRVDEQGIVSIKDFPLERYSEVNKVIKKIDDWGKDVRSDGQVGLCVLNSVEIRRFRKSLSYIPSPCNSAEDGIAGEKTIEADELLTALYQETIANPDMTNEPAKEPAE